MHFHDFGATPDGVNFGFDFSGEGDASAHPSQEFNGNLAANRFAHIMEHSVLGGSKKYPLKEPFVQLIKGSLKTFLNAFTSPDKTTYPVASTNLQDFYNLVDVYLDAVFHRGLHRVGTPKIAASTKAAGCASRTAQASSNRAWPTYIGLRLMRCRPPVTRCAVRSG